jgi:hypothetical protein
MVKHRLVARLMQKLFVIIIWVFRHFIIVKFAWIIIGLLKDHDLLGMVAVAIFKISTTYPTSKELISTLIMVAGYRFEKAILLFFDDLFDFLFAAFPRFFLHKFKNTYSDQDLKNQGSEYVNDESVTQNCSSN